MVRRDAMDGGMSQLPRTRTSRVPEEVSEGQLRGESGSCTIVAFVEAVGWIAVVGVDDYFVAAGLEADCGVDDETLGAADAEVWMEEDDGAWEFGRHGVVCGGV